jgi:ribose transport system substrate-binding protein
MKKLLALLLAIVMVLAIAGCSSSEDSNDKNTGDNSSNDVSSDNDAATEGEFKAKDPSEIKICYSIKGKNAWLEQQAVGCLEACEELGIPEPTIVYNEDQADAASQSQAIEDMIALGPDAIIVDPTQATVIAAVLQSAADAGIIIIETDTVGDLDMVTASIGLDEYNAAYEQGSTLCAALNEGDKVVIIAGTQGDNNAENRLKGQQDACADAGIEVLDYQYADFSADKAASVMEDMITKFSGEFQGVLTPSDDMTVACINALEQAGIIDDVLVAGYGGFQIAVDAINDGTMFMTVGMRPYQCGYQAVQVINNILTKNEYPEETWIDVGAEMVTAENVDSWVGF